VTKEATASKSKPETNCRFRLKPEAKPVARLSINPKTTVILDDSAGFVVSAENLDHDLTPEESQRLEKWLQQD